MALVFVVSFFVKTLFIAAQILLALLMVFTIIDAFLLFSPTIKIVVKRNTARVLSLGDANHVQLEFENRSPINLQIKVVDGVPMQLQSRNFEHSFLLKKNRGVHHFTYQISPKERGVYHFQNTILFLNSFLKLAERRIEYCTSEDVACYPSILQMKKIELLSWQRNIILNGEKKQRKIGSSYEFEQIKDYVNGDDYRHINWKATGKMNKLMLDQYEDEKSQQIYFLLDKSRNLMMPFNGLSLLDYSINATLAISNVAIKKQDKVGLISFSNAIYTQLKSEKNNSQLKKINELLYNEQATDLEADFELLYHQVRHFIHGRSMLFLFTNFESSFALNRIIPVLRSVNKLHLLVVIFFENTEVTAFANKNVKQLRDIFDTTIAATMQQEKIQILKTLNQYGIQAIITKPEDLNINTLNKYLQLKKSRSL